MIPIRRFVPTVESLGRLWTRFDENRAQFSDELPRDQIGFVCWLASDQICVLDVGPADDPIGVFIFDGIERGEAAWAHIFIWDRDRYPHADLVVAARAACGAAFAAYDLARINGLTPTTHLHARVFAERVGFIVEGRVRKACRVGGLRTDAWLSGLLPEDLAEAARLDPHTPPATPDTIDPAPVRAEVG